ncbi:MAG TPA: iron-containing alcohol dehydrogenase [Phototrophicaceae bacterium]|jgi:glycerol-1-phosphate dehydrogenase [NAD(P)+]|nr:iron-containing alcohol dehydrogenase [Phototrophicaceae bacterium]
MTTIWNLPRIDIQELSSIKEDRPTALLTGRKAWDAVGTMVNLPLVVQAEPHTAERSFMDSLAEGLPPQVEVVYGVGGGLVCDIAKYVAAKRNLPVTLIPTALSVDGFFTPIVAVRESGTVGYDTTGPADNVIIDWEIVSNAPANIRGTGIVEILSIVTGLLDWRYAAERNKNTPETRFQPWAASLAAGIAQQAFKIARDVGMGKVEALAELLDLICIEVQLTNQLGHTRPQEGSEQYFAYAIEPKVARNRGVPYADLVGPGILISAALHGQDIAPLKATLASAGIRLGELPPNNIYDTLIKLPNYVRQHNLPYSILHETDITPDKAKDLINKTGLNVIGA